MREILFRGKRVDNGEWVYGGITRQNHTLNCKEYIISPYHFDGHEEDEEFELIEVTPETVGQFTGLTDKNEDKIFEGDILEVDGGDEICNSVIEWDSELAGWVDYRDFDGDSFRCLEGDMDWCQYTRIIGNIHDYPELIGK